MKKTCLTLFSLFLFLSAYPQDLQFEYQAGLGYYKMTELKTFLLSRTGLLPFDPELTDDFPPYFFHSPTLLLVWDRIEVGLTWTHLSTGARYSLKDYSGEYLLESILKSNGPGFAFNYCLNPKHRLGILIGNKLGWVKTKMILIENLYLDDLKKVDEEYIFRGGDLSWEPGIKISYPLSVFQFHIYAGYAFILKGKGLYTEQEGEKIFLLHQGNPVHSGWNGLRWGGGVAISFARLN